MPQEPKKRQSRARQGKRRSNIKLKLSSNAHKLNKHNKSKVTKTEIKQTDNDED